MRVLWIYYLILPVFSFSRDKRDNEKIVFANVLFRHGERTPLRPYHNDPYGNSEYWPEGWGQLMNEGKHSHYLLGQWLRQRYSHLLGERYSPSSIHIMSTDVDRCLMSAQSNLAGMFPPSSGEDWGPIKWQPIPVHTAPGKVDKVLTMRCPCPTYDKLNARLKTSDEIQGILERYSEVFNYVSEKMGVEINSLNDMEHLYTTLTIQKIRNLTAPEWTNRVFPEPARTIVGQWFKTKALTERMKRLFSGPLLKLMIELFENKTRGTNDRKAQLFFAHDCTVGAFLHTLGLFNDLPPPFSAAVLVELREKDGDHFVQVSYKNTTGEPFLLEVPNCGAECRLSVFKTIYQNYLPDKWDEECNDRCPIGDEGG